LLIFLLSALSAESKKIKKVLCVLSVSAVKMNTKIAPFEGVHQATFFRGGI
jgi:hypothetical protein